MSLTTASEPRTPHDELIRVIRRVRNRWRVRVAVRGAAIVLGTGLLALFVSAYGMEYFRFSAESVIGFRVLAYVALAALTVRFLVLPLSRTVSDERVALYIEEHEPSLESVLLSAVGIETTSDGQTGGRADGRWWAGKRRGGRRGKDKDARPKAPRAASDASPALTQRLVESAVEKVRAIHFGHRVEQGKLYRASGVLASVAMAGMVAVVVGPTFLRHGARLVLMPWRTAEAASPYSIAVVPGDTALARGGDQRIAARLNGFDADRVELAVRRGAAGQWERVLMSAGAASGEYVFQLFDLNNRTEYFVEADGVRSPIYRIAVSDLPYVRRIDLEYRFPAYTGLAPRTEEDGGDIVALRGTTVLVRAVPTFRVPGGRILIDGRDTIPLASLEDGALAGAIEVQRSGFYKVQLQSVDGSMVPSSLDYTIDALTDEPPSVAFAKPGRDMKVTSVEEVFTQLEAEDDYGIDKLELVYSVNGDAEERIALRRGGKKQLKEVSAGHTFFLEELELEPGDLISYFARATDADRIRGPKTATTDIYFMEVRPFGQEYRQADVGGMPGGQEAPGALVQRQREIIAGTFKTVRDRASTAEAEYRENLATLALAQGRLREQVEELLGRMHERGVTSVDSGFAKIAEELPKALEEMRAAEDRLGKREPKAALPPEQRALGHLQRSEAAFREVQVSFGNGSAGGGGGPQPEAEELADLFELETDKLRNQYESVQRGQQEAADQKVDETLERLRRLASRQQQENERMSRAAEEAGRRAGGQAGGGAGGGDGQRRLAQEAEKMARELERLSRERSAPELRESARQLREAANAMRRSASSGRDGRGLSDGSSALDRLEEARRLLDRSRTSRLERDAQDVLRRAEELARHQRELAADIEELIGGRRGAAPDGQSGADGREQRILERKDAMAEEVGDLESKLDRMASESRREQKEAARKLQEAANSIRDNRLREKIRFSQGVLGSGSPEYARNFEEQIGANVDELREKVGEAVDAISQPKEEQVAKALERTRSLVRGLESMEERTRERGSGADDRRGSAEESESEEGQQGGDGEASGGAGEGQQGGGEGGTGEPGGGRPGGQVGSPGGAGQGAPGGQIQGGGPGAPGGGAAPATGGRGFSPEDVRQFEREFRETRAEAEALRRELRRQRHEVGDLDKLIAQLRALESRRVYDDPEEFERLQASVIEGFKAFEFALRRAIEGEDGERLLLGGSDEVPPGYRELVEEYYRSLARRAPR